MSRRLPSGLHFELRPLRRTDASGVLTLERALSEAGAGVVRAPEDLPSDEAAMARELRPFLDGALAPPGGRYLVAAALEGGTVPILAAGELRRLPPARVRHVGVLALGVHPSVHRQGLGRLLVRRLVDWAFAQGILRVELYVRADNAPARALYESCGFSEEGRRRAFVRLESGAFVDDVVMAQLKRE